MFLRLAALPLLLTLSLPQVLRAEAHDGFDRLHAALRLDELVEVLRDEGIAYGEQVAEDLLTGAPQGFSEAVAEIYDAGRMAAEVRRHLAEELQGADLAPMIAFFEADPGRTLIGLEMAARQSMLDPEVEEAAKEFAALALADRTGRQQLVERFVVTNDLIDRNVAGAMNQNFAFFRGLAQGGALPPDVTDDQLLDDLWSQEPTIRANTTEWVYAYLLLAYSPAADADLETYIAFSESEAGQTLNAALFDTFDAIYGEISRAMGVASSAYMTTEEL